MYMQDPKHRAQYPYKALGGRLRYMRQERNETLLEASGAVEIEPEVLERIEAGTERPSEDILMLLINHFEVQEQDAVRLWETAGYHDEDTAPKRLPEQLEKAAVILLAMDQRTLYSDGLVIDANASGLTLNFTQASGPGQVTSVAKVGISYEQAEQALQTLQTAMLYGRHQSPRRLPPTKQ
jgi:transcriptional regulator with XRE-family HTH domain